MCWFLLYKSVTQPWVYICPLPREPPTHSPSHPSRSSLSTGLSVNILVHIVWWTYARIFVGFTVSTYLTLFDSSKVFSKVVPIYLTISSEWVFCSFTYSPILNIVSPFVVPVDVQQNLAEFACLLETLISYSKSKQYLVLP